MENEILKINILSMAISGFLMLISGVALYVLKVHLAGSIRFFLPLPPIGVAAYIFVFNMFKHYSSSVPNRSAMISELAVATVISSVIFFLFTAVLIFLIGYLKEL